MTLPFTTLHAIGASYLPDKLILAPEKWILAKGK